MDVYDFMSRRRSLCGLTFELSGRQRKDARPELAKMYRVPPTRAWWPAFGAPLERGVAPRLNSVEQAYRELRPYQGKAKCNC